MRKQIRTLLLGCGMLWCSSQAFGQGNLGAITGTIQDAGGGVIPEAALSITNAETGVNWTAKSSSAGYYRVPVPPGTYRLQAQKEGFKSAVADHIVVPVAQDVTLDVTLQIG